MITFIPNNLYQYNEPQFLLNEYILPPEPDPVP